MPISVVTKLDLFCTLNFSKSLLILENNKKTDVTRLLRTGYDPKTNFISKEFEPVKFDDEDAKKLNIMWDKNLSKSKYGEFRKNHGSRKSLLKKISKLRNPKNYSRMHNVGIIKPIFNYGKINTYNQNQY